MNDMPLPVLYADDWLAVIAKPAGLMAHASPMARGEDDFLVDRLRARFAVWIRSSLSSWRGRGGADVLRGFCAPAIIKPERDRVKKSQAAVDY